jgi:hypothetical protein
LISVSYIFYGENHCEIFPRQMANSRVCRNEWRSARTAVPAHSVKPPIMMELLELEDRRDLLLQILGKAKVADR